MFAAFFAPRVSKIRENTAQTAIFRVDKNATVSSVATCNKKKKKEEKKEEAAAAKEEHTQNFDKKMCGRMLTSYGMTRTSHSALRLRTSRAHEPHQRPHYYTVGVGVVHVPCWSGGAKSKLAKAAGAETSAQMRDEKLHAVVARAHFE